MSFRSRIAIDQTHPVAQGLRVFFVAQAAACRRHGRFHHYWAGRDPEPAQVSTRRAAGPQVKDCV